MTRRELTLGDLLRRLSRVTATRTGWEASCPAHRDRHPSLSIHRGHTLPVVLHCHAGCSIEAIEAALGLEAMPPDPIPYSEEEIGRRQAMRRAFAAPWRRPRTRLLMALADLHRYQLHEVQRLQALANAMPPDLGATWDLLALAQRLEDERRLVEAVLDPMSQAQWPA